MKKLCLIFIMITTALFVFAQNQWKNYTDTRHANKIIASDQTLWLATEGGLIEIDCLEHDTVFFNHANSDLPFTKISDICTDNMGRLWLTCSSAGLACKSGDSFQVFNTGNTPLPNDSALAIACDSQGNIWAAFYRNLVKFDGNNWTTYHMDSIGTAFYNPIKISIDANDRVLFHDVGLMAFDGTHITRYNTSNSPLPDNNINFVQPFPNGEIWIGHTYRGLTITDFNTWNTYDTLVPGKLLVNVTAFTDTQDGNYWLGNEAGDLYYHNGSTWTLQHPETTIDSLITVSYLETNVQDELFVSSSDRLSSFSDGEWNEINTSHSEFQGNSIESIFVGSDQVKWMANHKGIMRFWNNQFANYHGDDSTAWFSARGFTENMEGTVFAFQYYGVSWFGENTWHRYPIVTTGFFENMNISDMSFDHNNNLFIATWPGVVKFDGTSVSYYSPYYNNFPDNIVYCLETDNDGKIMAGVDDGIVIWNGTTWQKRTIPNPPVSENKVFDIAVAGPITWMATAGGLISFDGSNWEFYNPSNSPMPEYYTPTLDIDDNGVIWMINGSNNLIRFDGQQWQVFTYFQTGMANGNLTSLRADHFGNIWMGGYNTALSVYNENGLYLDAATSALQSEQQNLIRLVYPNPATDEITLNLNLTEDQRNCRIEITDLNGRVVASQAIFTYGIDQQIKTAKLTSGQYIISVISDSKRLASSKVLVVR